MQDNPEASDLEPHIRAAMRPGSESARLLRALVDRSWPGGTRDRLEPLARGWLSAWGPTRTTIELPSCGCRSGACTVCN